MITEVIKAILYAGVPIGVFTFLMVYYAYYKGYLSPDISIRKAFQEKDHADKKLSKKNKKALLFLHSKWLTFGGGFYGLMALLTFIYIEVEQIVNFLIHASGLQDFINLFTLNSLINMIVDSLINMVKAALWFSYWPDIIHISNGFVWLLIVYIGYRAGANLAQRYVLKKLEFMD
ncbi:hypothetical protein AAD001_04440 [Colwelliaceae bacterium 6471]